VSVLPLLKLVFMQADTVEGTRTTSLAVSCGFGAAQRCIS
jgi:hypothetical protein